MKSTTETIEQLAEREYEWGFVTDIESESLPPGLNEDVIRWISAKKKEPEFLLEWRLKAFRQWQKMEEPEWAFVKYDNPGHFWMLQILKSIRHENNTSSAWSYTRQDGVHEFSNNGFLEQMLCV